MSESIPAAGETICTRGDAAAACFPPLAGELADRVGGRCYRLV